MNSKPLSPHDPKLTAYALGELDLEESARVADALKNDATARAVVEEIRALAGQLQEALENEPVLTQGTASPVPSAETPASGEKMVPFPGLWILALAAACVMVTVASLPSHPGSSSEKARVAQSEARPVPVAQSADTSTPIAPPEVHAERPVLPVVDNRKRVLSAEPSDVKPAPLRDDGLETWRSVTDVREVSDKSTVVAKDSSNSAVSADSTTYSSAEYKNAGAPKTVPVLVDASGRVTDSDHALSTLTEVVSLDALEAAKVRPQPLSSDFSDELLQASKNLHDRELLTLKISYRLPAVDLVQSVELPQIATGVNLALGDKDFKFAMAAADLGKKLKETPRKPAVPYDQILSWAEENSDHPAEGSNKPRNETGDEIKRTVE